MSEIPTSTEKHPEPRLYEIRIKGHLDNRWAEWFEGLTIRREDNGETRLVGPVVDQAALHGLLRRVRDLGLPLVSVLQVDPEQANESPLGANANPGKDGSYGSRADQNHSNQEIEP